MKAFNKFLLMAVLMTRSSTVAQVPEYKEFYRARAGLDERSIANVILHDGDLSKAAEIAEKGISERSYSVVRVFSSSGFVVRSSICGETIYDIRGSRTRDYYELLMYRPYTLCFVFPEASPPQARPLSNVGVVLNTSDKRNARVNSAWRRWCSHWSLPILEVHDAGEAAMYLAMMRIDAMIRAEILSERRRNIP